MLSKLKLKKDEYDSIYTCGGTDCDKARRLMQLVNSRGEPALKVFKDTLQDCNPELYERLQQTEEVDHGSSSVTLEKAVFSSDHDSDDSASSGIESLSPTRSFTPNDDEEVDRSAEPVRMTKREINEMMEDLEKKGKGQRLQSNMKEATSTYSKLAQLTGLCAKQEEGELGFGIMHFNLKGAKEMLQQSYTDGTLKENVQEPLANLAKGKPHNFLNMEVDVDLQWSEEQGKSRQKEDAKGQDGIIKVTGKNVQLADGHVLEEGSEGAFECLCNHLVENKDELIPIIRYLNSIDIQVCGITRGCIELKFRCFNQDAAVHLQEKETIQRLKASFQSVVSAFMKQFGLESLELDIKCQFCQDKAEEAPPELIATSQPAVYPLTGAQTTTYTAISRPTSATLQTDAVNTGTPENKVQEEHPPSKSNTVNMTNKAANTSGLDRATSVDNLMAPPSPIKPVEHSNLRGLFLAMVGGKDLSCADAADDGSRLHVTFRQVQTALQTRSEKAQQQQKDVLKAAREGTDGIIYCLRKEITRLTQKDEKAQKILLDHKQENQQLKETNKTKEDEIEKLTAENTKLSNQLPDLHDQVRSLTEKDKTSQMALSEKTQEIQLLQKTNDDLAAKVVELLRAKRLVKGDRQGGVLRKEKRGSETEKRQSGSEDASEASVKDMSDTAVATPMESEEDDSEPMRAELSLRNKLYTKISENLSEDEVKSLRETLITEGLLGRVRVQNAQPHEIFCMLEDNQRIGRGNLGLLKDLLKALGKEKLAMEAEDVEKEEGRRVFNVSKRTASEDKLVQAAGTSKQLKVGSDDEGSDHSDSCAESGIGCSASDSLPEELDTELETKDSDSGSNTAVTAEEWCTTNDATFATVGEVRKRIDYLKIKIAKLTRDPTNVSEAKSGELFKACQELSHLCQILEKQRTGELKVDIELLDPVAQKEFRQGCKTGAVSQKIQMEVKQIIRSTSDDIVNVKPDVRVDFSQSTHESTNSSPERRAIIKVTAEDVQLEDSCKLDKDSAVRRLFKYLVQNRKKLRPIVNYLNSLCVQVTSISYGSIMIECICLTPESAVRLQEEYDGQRLHAQFQRLISDLTISTEFDIKSISLAVQLTFAHEDETEKASPEQSGAIPPTSGQSSTCTVQHTSATNPPTEDIYTAEQSTVRPSRFRNSRILVESLTDSKTTTCQGLCPTSLQFASAIPKFLVHCADWEGMTTLSAAMVPFKFPLRMRTMDHLPSVTVEMLLGKGADVNMADKDGRTPLWIAAQKGQLPTSEILLSKGADVNMTDKDCRTPLWIAAQEG